MNKNGQFYINAIVTRKINEGIYKEFFEEDINKINLWLYEKQYSLNLCTVMVMCRQSGTSTRCDQSSHEGGLEQPDSSKPM